MHLVCRDMGFTHMEGLANLDQVVGKGRFRFIGFPLKDSRRDGQSDPPGCRPRRVASGGRQATIDREDLAGHGDLLGAPAR